jgi:cell division protein FtsI/penicillin-binding protein 2
MKKELVSARRVYVLVAVMGLWGTVIGTRLYFLQVVRSEGYRASAKTQQQRTVPIVPPRGGIFDRNGNALAVSVPVKSIYADPAEVEDVAATAKALASIIGMPKALIADKLTEPGRFVWLKRKVAESEALAIGKARLPGIGVSDEFQRSYPNKELAAQVLGYVGSEQQGLAGLELQYDELIRGEEGKAVYLTDGKRRRYNESAEPAQPGARLITTLDKNIQYFVRQGIRDAVERTRATAIHVIVMDPRNGEILAMENYPSFDPNSYGAYDPHHRKNGSIDHTYEPGSTFKILTVGAALEEGLTNPGERIDCLHGAIVVSGQRIRDHKSFGVLSVSEILEKSSDVGVITLGLRLKEERMAKYIKLYGFGKATGIDLPGEERGLTKSTAKWTKSSIGYISMGQEIGVTPLQIVNLTAMVANGGTLYRPYVVKEVRDSQGVLVSSTEPTGRRVMSEKSARQMQDMLEKVVTDGTATAAKLDGYRAAGKTGTAEKSDGSGYSETKLIASFAGYAPASNPIFAMVVVVDEPVGAYHGGEVAAPIFKHIADQILHNKGISPDIQDYAPRHKQPPAIRKGDPAPVARPSELDQLKIISANFSKPIPAGDIPVPDFRGKSEAEAYDESRRLGLKTESQGLGRIRQQYPMPGALVRSGTVVNIWLSPK